MPSQCRRVSGSSGALSDETLFLRWLLTRSPEPLFAEIPDKLFAKLSVGWRSSTLDADFGNGRERLYRLGGL